MQTKLIVICIGVILLVGMTVYLPWNLAVEVNRGNTTLPREFLVYNFMFSPPKLPPTFSYTAKINFFRLGLQWFSVIALTGAVLFFLTLSERNKGLENLRKELEELQRMVKAKESNKEKS